MIGGRSERRLEVACTIEVEHTQESLHAHVELAGDVIIEPGDQVLVHGDPIHTTFGERIVLHRRATILRASPMERLWTRALAYLELTELYEVGFTAGRGT